MSHNGCCGPLLFKGAMDYQTNKIAVIRNTWIVYFHRLFQLGIIGYVLGYSLWYQKGYQDSYGLSSSVIVKVKGIGISNRSDIHRKIWDIIDTVVPPQENNAFFITTNVIETGNQKQGVCAENPTVAQAICQKDSDCKKNKILHLGHGVMTGKCVLSEDKENKTCEIDAWCPVEIDSGEASNNPLLLDVPNYTVLIKNAIIFNEINVQRSNLFPFINDWLSHTCIYNASNASLKYCPIFNMSSIIGNTSETDLRELLTYGGIIRIIITWNCNLDRSLDLCRPEYKFDHLYTKFGKFRGYNFRYANYYERDHKEYRVLYKVFGIRILIETRGKAQKFSPFTLSMNIGSGLALLTIATFVCDIFITTVMPQKKKYRKMVYEIHSVTKKEKLPKDKSRDIPLIEEKVDS